MTCWNEMSRPDVQSKCKPIPMKKKKGIDLAITPWLWTLKITLYWIYQTIGIHSCFIFFSMTIQSRDMPFFYFRRWANFKRLGLSNHVITTNNYFSLIGILHVWKVDIPSFPKRCGNFCPFSGNGLQNLGIRLVDYQEDVEHLKFEKSM